MGALVCRPCSRALGPGLGRARAICFKGLLQQRWLDSLMTAIHALLELPLEQSMNRCAQAGCSSRAAGAANEKNTVKSHKLENVATFQGQATSWPALVRGERRHTQ